MVALRIHVQPGSSQNEIVGWEGEVLRVRLRARAVEGKANRSLVEFLAEALGIRPRQVTLVRGERSREKLIEVDLPSPGEVAARLARKQEKRTPCSE